MGRCRALKIPTLAPYLNSSLSSYYTPSPSKLSLASAFNIDLDLFPPNREHSEAASAPHYPPNTLVPILRRMTPCPKLTGLNTNQERFSMNRASSHTFRSDHLTTSDTFWYCIGAKDVWWNHSKPHAGSQSIPLQPARNMEAWPIGLVDLWTALMRTSSLALRVRWPSISKIYQEVEETSDSFCCKGSKAVHWAPWTHSRWSFSEYVVRAQLCL